MASNRRIADLMIKIGADSYEFQQKTRQVEKGLDGVSKKLTSIGKNLSLKLTAPLVALGGVSLHLADVQMKAEAKVQQALKSTNQAVGLNFRQLADYASQLQGKTLFGDEKILNESTAQLLTFTNIAGENFKRTQAMALDLSTVLDGDLKSSSIQLGKALNDPVKNLTALSRAGIQFSKDQTKLIKSLAETNRLSEAQGLILDELERQYGGQAAAAAKVGLGPIQQLKNTWGDFLEQIGAAIMPFAQKVAKALSIVVVWLQSISPEMKKVIVVVAGVAAAIGPLALGVGGLIKILPLLAAGFTALLSPVGLVVATVMALGAAFAYARVQKMKMIDELAATKTLEELQAELKTNAAEQKRVAETTTKWRYVSFGSVGLGGASMIGGTFQKVPDGSKLKPLRKEQELLTAAIKKKEAALVAEREAQEEANRVAEEARLRAEEMAKAITNLTQQQQQSTGLIGQITAQIAGLEKKKLLAGSAGEIAALNAEIKKMRKELSALQGVNVGKTTLDKQSPITAGVDVNSLFKISITPVDLSPIVSNFQNIKNKLRESFKDLGGLSADGYDRMATGISQAVEKMVENGQDIEVATNNIIARVAEASIAMADSINASISDCMVDAFDALGQVLAGDLGLDGLLKMIISSIAGFLKKMGSQLISFGVMMVGFKKALAAVLANPWLAIAVGGAMVAAAAIMTSLVNKNAKNSVPKLARGGLAYGATYAMVGDNPNASVDPEVIAPLSKLKSLMGSGAQNVQIAISGQLRAQGRDLVYVFKQEDLRTVILGG